MPIQHAIWKVGATPEALTVSKLATEKDLEDMITARPEMIQWGQASRINIRFKMITEDQLEQLAIQWHETLSPALSHGRGSQATDWEHRTNMEHWKKEKIISQ